MRKGKVVVIVCYNRGLRSRLGCGSWWLSGVLFESVAVVNACIDGEIFNRGGTNGWGSLT